MPRPQFSLKAIMVIIAVLGVPLAMMVSGQIPLIQVGVLLALPLLFGCIGYLVGGWRYVPLAVLLAVIAFCLTSYILIKTTHT